MTTYEHVTDVNNRVRPPETTSYPALTLQKFDFSSKYISSIEVQCGELTALSTWSKIAAGHLPTSSHNFAWRGVINLDRANKLTLQNKYDHTMPAGYPKVAYPLEISFWIRNLFTHGQTLPGRFAIDSEAIDRRVDVVYRDVITGSRESRDHHFDARLIHRILKSLLPQNNTFFIATASVPKDAADNPDCQGLREQWYYLRFYVRRTMPPTVSPVNSPNKGRWHGALMLSLICDWTNV